MQEAQGERDHWLDALQAARLLAVDPHGLGGALIHAGHGPVRDAWLMLLQTLLPESTPMRRLPLSVSDDRLLGGLDLAATLQAGRPVVQRGLLAEAHQGVIVAAMAERMSEHTAARLCAALDRGEVVLEREGLHDCSPARIAVVALDESTEEDDPPPVRLLERLAFRLDLARLSPVALQGVLDTVSDDASLRDETLQARRKLARVRVPEEAIEALCNTAAALGIQSLRAPLLALRAACAAAALDERETIEADDLALAARLVLAPRATQWPTSAQPDAESPDDPTEEPPEVQDAKAEASEPDSPEPLPEPPESPESQAGQDASSSQPDAGPEGPQEDRLPPSNDDAPDDQAPSEITPEMLDALVLEAARAAIPEGLLQQLRAGQAMRAARGRSGGRAGATRSSRQRGRPIGSRAGIPRDGARLAVIDTLRAAAPWQRLRAAAQPCTQVTSESASPSQFIPVTGPQTGAGQAPPQPVSRPRVQVRASDFRVMRLQERSQTTTVFAVDASGSSALHRLAEAKGAVELLLAECYVRRDQVAVVAFRGRAAEVLLAPTRSLARARRELSGLPGGGGTPLSQGIDTAAALADAMARKGGTPIVVLLTDGKANVAHDGTGGRAQAQVDAREAAQRLRLAGHAAMLIDTSPRPSSDAQALARCMGAAYIPLPQADAAAMSRSVQAATRAALNAGG